MTDARVSLVISAIDKVSKPFKAISRSSGDFEKRLERTTRALGDMSRKAGDIKRLEKLNKQLGKTSSDLDLARKKVAALAKGMKSVKEPSVKMTREFEKAKAAAQKLAKSHRTQKAAIDPLRASLRATGTDTRRLGEAATRTGARIDKLTDSMVKMRNFEKKREALKTQRNTSLSAAASTSFVGSAISTTARRMGGAMMKPIDELRNVASAKSALASVGVKDLDAIANVGKEMSKKWAGITAAAFVSAAYDIKSGVSSLSDQGVAEMTAAAALAGKATKAEVGQMTSLFATAHGIFKGNLSELSDGAFADRFGATLSASVQQFKTTGSQMQQAIESAGSEGALLGVSMAEEMTILGMLQQKMQAGDAGTAFKAFAGSAQKAQDAFNDMGLLIDVVNSDGKLNSLSDIIADVKSEMGEDYTAEIGAQLAKAFGRKEAVKVISNIWENADALNENIKSLEEQGQLGKAFTEKMATDMGNNIDDRLIVMGQRFDLLLLRIGEKMLPILERALPYLERFIDSIGSFIDNNAPLTTVLAGLALGVVGVGLVVGPVITALAGLVGALALLRYTSGRAALGVAGAAANGGGGYMGGGGRRGKGLFGKGLGMAGKLGGRALGSVAGLVMGGLMVGDSMTNDSLTAKEKGEGIGGGLGSMGGGLGGAMMGAAIGSVVPVVGTMIGGIIGGALGAWGGEKAGAAAGGYIGGAVGQEDLPKKTAAAAMVATSVIGSPAVASPNPLNIQNPKYEINVQVPTGMDSETVAVMVADEIDRRNREASAESRGRLHD